jgi:hypothetical protein
VRSKCYQIDGADLRLPKVDDLREDPGELAVKNKKIGLRTYLCSIK